MNQPHELLPRIVGDDGRFTEGFEEEIDQLVLRSVLDLLGCFGFPAVFQACRESLNPLVVICLALDTEKFSQRSSRERLFCPRAEDARWLHARKATKRVRTHRSLDEIREVHGVMFALLLEFV